MKKIYAIAAIALLLGLSSCLSTVQPIFTEKDLVFDQRIIGKWGYETKSTTETITPEKAKEMEKQPGAKKLVQTIHNASITTGPADAKISYNGYTEITKAVARDVENYPALQKLLGKMYMVKYTDETGVASSVYYGFLVKLGQKLYMDYFPAETQAISKYNEFYKSHYVKLHTCYSIRFLKDNSFELKQFDGQFLKNLVDNKKIRIRHEVRDDD